MPRLQVRRALSYRAGDLVFRRGHPLEIEDENVYHMLIGSGEIHDPDKQWESILPPNVLPRLGDGADVLVARAHGLGDVLMVSIALRELARQYPRLRFRYAVASGYVTLFRDAAFLASVEPLWTIQGHHPHVIELRGLSERSQYRTHMDRIDLFARYLGVTISDYSFPLTVTDAERETGRGWLAATGRVENIVLALRGSTEVRTWQRPLVERFAAEAAGRGFGVALIDPQPQPFPENEGVANLSGKLRIPDLLGVVAAATWVVAPDTGVVHLAEACGTRCVAIYSTIPPALRLGHYKNVRALWRGSELSCCPCFDGGCKPMPCLSGIHPGHVFAVMERFDTLGIEVPPRLLALNATPQAA